MEELLPPAHQIGLVYASTANSTNELVISEIGKPNPPPFIIAVTDFQRYGRGRGEHRWVSTKGKDIALSIACHAPSFRVSVSTRYALACAVLVARGIQDSCGIPVETKWPNDLYVGERKLAGILIQNLRQYLVTGIGINANSLSTDFPNELQGKLTTIRQILGHEVDRVSIIMEVAKNFLSYFEGRVSNEDALLNEWVARCRIIGKKQQVRLQDRILDATVKGIDRQTGELICVDEAGNVIRVHLADSLI